MTHTKALEKAALSLPPDQFAQALLSALLAAYPLEDGRLIAERIAQHLREKLKEENKWP